LYVSEAGLASSLDTMRNFGGAGYLSDAPFGTDIQDAVGGVIYSGTSDMQKVIIAAELGLV
jgi:L-prolyl-PCP dehydrogenase